jgi:hypothetical protein
MNRHVTLDQVKAELRARVCQHCPLRYPGDPGDPIDTETPLGCEPGCQMFEHLPHLAECARQIDPMLRSVDEAIRYRISETLHAIAHKTGADPRSAPLNRHRSRLVRTLTELVYQ